MPSGRILLGLFCEQLSAHPAPSASSLLDTDSAWRLRRAKVRGQTAEMPAPPNEPSETILAPADASTLPWPCHPDLACFRPAHLCWLRSAMRRCLALCSSISACSARFLSSSSAIRFDFRACWSFANFCTRARFMSLAGVPPETPPPPRKHLVLAIRDKTSASRACADRRSCRRCACGAIRVWHPLSPGSPSRPFAVPPCIVSLFHKKLRFPESLHESHNKKKTDDVRGVILDPCTAPLPAPKCDGCSICEHSTGPGWPLPTRTGAYVACGQRRHAAVQARGGAGGQGTIY